MRMRLRLVESVLCTSLWLGACGREPAPPNADLILTPQTRVVAAPEVMKVERRLLVLSPDAVTGGVEVGQVLVGQDAEGNAFLREAVAVSRSPDGYWVDTTDAGLADVFARAKIRIEVPLAPHDPGPAPRRFSPQVEFSKGVWTIKEKIVDEPNVKFSVEGKAELAPSLHVEIDIDCNTSSWKSFAATCRKGDITATRAYIQGVAKASMNFKIKGSLKKTWPTGDLTLAEEVLPAVTVVIGGVPIVINPTLRVYLAGELTLGGSTAIDGGYEAQSKVQLGAAWEKSTDQWSLIDSFEKSAGMLPVKASTEIYLEAKAHAGIVVGTLFYSVLTGPSVEVGPQTSVRVAAENPWWTWNGGLFGSFAFKSKFLGVELFDYEKKLFEWNPILAQSAPESRITQGPLVSTTSHDAQFRFDAFGHKRLKRFECRLDMQLWAECTSPKTYSSLDLGAHIFEVRAVDSLGVNESTPPFYRWNIAPLPVAPAVPSGLVATSIAATGVSLAFVDNADNEVGFEVQRKVGSGQFLIVAVLDADQTTWVDDEVIPETAYTYRVRAFNGYNPVLYSDWSLELNALTPSAPPVLPASPTGLTATPLSESEVNLVWQDNADNETGYRLERRLAGGTYAVIANLGVGAAAYADAFLAASTDYEYRVAAVNAAGTSAYSNQAAVTTLTPAPTPPGQVLGLTVSNAVAKNTLSWSVVTYADSYKVYWATSPGVSTASAYFTAVGTTVQHTVPTCYTTYYYRVAAVNEAGAGTLSDERSVAVGVCAPPTTPTGFLGSFNGTANTLTWSSSATATQYRIYWGTSAGVSTSSNLLTTSSLSYLHTGMVCGSTYYYRISAANTAGESTLSAEIAVPTTGCGLPSVPTISASNGGGTSNSISWTTSAGATGYKVYMSTSGEPTYANLWQTVASSTTSLTHNSLACGTYYYRVAASNANGDSLLSNTAQATVGGVCSAPDTPTNFQVSGTTTFTLSWTHVANASGYRIYWGLSPSNISYSLTGLTSSPYYRATDCGLTYYFQIVAYNAVGESPRSPYIYSYSYDCPLDLSIGGLSGYSPVGRGVVYFPQVTVNRTGASLTYGTYVLVRVYLSSDMNITNTDYLCSSDSDASSKFSNATLNANGILTQQVLCVPPTTMPAGAYYWGAIADEVNVHAEGNETNNKWTSTQVQVQ